MKRYLIFQFDIHYPAGGMRDLKARYNTLDEVWCYLNENEKRYDIYYVYDIVENKEVILSLSSSFCNK